MDGVGVTTKGGGFSGMENRGNGPGIPYSPRGQSNIMRGSSLVDTFLLRASPPPGLTASLSVMLQAIRDHNSEILVVDEISRAQEVEACAEIKAR